jgi:inhibitor of cysteine peptidase
MTGYTFTPANIRVTANKNLTGQNFAATALPRYSISGKVTLKAGGASLAGVTVALSGSATGSTTTGSDGSYSFGNLLTGSYTLTPSMAGWSFSPQNARVAIANRNVAGANFTATALLSISGSVLTVGGAPFSGVTVNLSGASNGSTITRADGSYSFTGLQSGSYTLKPSMTGCTFSPPSTTIILTKNATAQNFTATASISGTVEAGGSPVAGSTVTLSGTAKGTTTTAAKGTYSFSGLLKGQYTLTASKRGYTFNSQPVAITDGNLTGVVISGKQN